MSKKRAAASSSSSSIVGAFKDDLPVVQYGFGDVLPEEQDPKTTEALDDVLCDYVRFLGGEAAKVGDGSKISLEDALFVLRKDKKKHDRIRELVIKQKQMEKVQKSFKQPENGVN